MIAVIIWGIFILAIINGINWRNAKPAREAEAKRIKALPPLSASERKTVADAEAYFKDYSIFDGKPWQYNPTKPKK